MKTARGALLSFLTLTALVLGMFLPAIVSVLQSSGTPNQPQRFSVETIALEATEPAEVLDMLKLMSGYPSAMVLDAGNVLSAEEADDAAFAVLEFMAEHGIPLDLQAYTVRRQTPFFISTNDGEEMGIIWACEFSDPDGGSMITINLDDETGKMVAFAHIGSPVTQVSAVSAYGSIADDWAAMCAEYYDFEYEEADNTIGGDFSEKLDFSFRNSEELLVLPFDVHYITDRMVYDNATEVIRMVVIFNNSIYDIASDI